MFPKVSEARLDNQACFPLASYEQSKDGFSQLGHPRPKGIGLFVVAFIIAVEHSFIFLKISPKKHHHFEFCEALMVQTECSLFRSGFFVRV